MNLLPGVQRVTGDVAIGITTVNPATGAVPPVRVYSVHLVSGATASTCTLKNGTTTSGDVYVQIDGIASQGQTLNFAGGLRFPAGCFFDADANISSAVVTFVQEF